jgi:hypothetical protein
VDLKKVAKKGITSSVSRDRVAGERSRERIVEKFTNVDQHTIRAMVDRIIE